MKRFKVTLTADERVTLRDLIAAGKGAARKLTHARILLKADASDDGLHWPDWRIADALEVHVSMVERVRQRFVEIDGRAEARLIALACSPPPEDRATWTMQLLADKLVELEVVESISDETVRRALKKTKLSRG